MVMGSLTPGQIPSHLQNPLARIQLSPHQADLMFSSSSSNPHYGNFFAWKVCPDLVIPTIHFRHFIIAAVTADMLDGIPRRGRWAVLSLSITITVLITISKDFKCHPGPSRWHFKRRTVDLKDFLRIGKDKQDKKLRNNPKEERF